MCNLIHTDLKPENILICLSEEETLRIHEEGHITKKNAFYELIKKFREKHEINVLEESEVFKGYGMSEK